MAEVASAFVSLVPSARGFGRQLDGQIGSQVDDSGRRAGGRFSGAFASSLKAGAMFGGVLAAAAGISFFKGAISEASDLNESVNAVGVTFGKNAAGIRKLGEDAAQSLGLSETQFNSIAVQFSAFAGTIAGKGGDVVGTMDKLTTRGADFASVMNLEVNEAMGLFQSGLAGETEPLRKFGIDLSAARVEAFAYAQGIGAAGKPLTEQQKVQARYGLLMRQTAKTQGDFADTSDGLANSQRILKAEFANLQAEVGTVLLPVLARLVSWAADFLPKIMSLGDSFGSLGGPVSSVVGYFQQFLPVVQGLARDFVNMLLPGIRSIADVVMNDFMPAFRDLLPIITPIAKFLLQMFGEAVIGAVRGFIQVIRGVVKVVSGVIELVVALINGDWKAAWKALKKIVDGVLDAIIGALKVWWYGSVLALFRRAAQFLLKGIWVSLWNGLKAVAQRGWNALTNLVAAGVRAVLNFFRNLGSTAASLWRSLWRAIQSLASAAWRTLRSGFSAFGTAIKNVFTSLGDAIRTAIRGALDFVVSAVKAVPGKIKALGGAFLEAGRAIIGKLVDGLKNASGIVSGIAGNVWNAVRGMLNNAIGKINAALEFRISLPGPDVVVNPPNIPYLASGGIVSRPTLAMIGEGREREAVLPLSELQTLIDTGGRGRNAPHTNVEQLVVRDEREAFRQIETLNRRAALQAAMP